MFGNSIKGALAAAIKKTPGFNPRKVHSGMVGKGQVHPPRAIVTHQRSKIDPKTGLVKLVPAKEKVQLVAHKNPFTGRVVTKSGDVW